MAFSIPLPATLDNPLLGFRFGVFFLGVIGVAHPLDFRFQSVSGLGVRLELGAGDDLGANANKRALPEKIKYNNLSLKRGLPILSTLRLEVQKSFSEFQFKPRNVIVSILDENALPLSSWFFSEAFPVKWSLSELSAESSSVIVEELELKYKSFKRIAL